MKKYLAALAIVLLAGSGAAVRAQVAGPDSQQPEEIPAQYQQPPYPGQQPGGPPPSGQQAAPNSAQNDLPAGRISFIHGDVTTQRADTGEWVAATINTPVVPGDHLATGPDSRVEVQLDNANILRLADSSEVNIANYSTSLIQLQMGRGLATFDVLNGSQSDVEIDTPNASIHPQMGEGSYRITVNSDGETIVDVRKGAADISTPEGSTRVDDNQRITVEGTENAQYQISPASGKDDWDKFNSDRDHTITSAQSWQHTNPYYVGSQDLDGYGQWESAPDYGSVWVPAAAPGWAPYRDGRWVFEPYYGWTWVSYEPWGWAPYHYGRWFMYGNNWAWWPGPVYSGYRPVWAPAYVSFIGFGGGGLSVGVGFGFGSVGWLPIGPGDYYHPWYGRGVTRVDVVNITNIHTNNVGGFAPLRRGPGGVSNLDRAMTDDRVRGGMSSMSADQFGRGRVPMQQQRFDANTFRQGSMMTAAVPVTPNRASMRPSDRAVSPGAIPNRAVTQQRFFTRPAAGGARTGQPGAFSRGGAPGGATAVRPNVPQYSNQSHYSTQQYGRQPGNASPSAGQPQAVQPQQGVAQPGAVQQNAPQQNGGRPGFQRFGGQGNAAPSQPGNAGGQGQRPYTPSLNQQGGRTGSYTPPANTIEPGRPVQPNGGFRTYQPPAGNPQPPAGNAQPNVQQQPNNRQTNPQAQQAQPYTRGGFGNAGNPRPALQVQQPIMTPRNQGSTPSPRGGQPSGGGQRGGNRGGSSGEHSGRH